MTLINPRNLRDGAAQIREQTEQYMCRGVNRNAWGKGARLLGSGCAGQGLGQDRAPEGRRFADAWEKIGRESGKDGRRAVLGVGMAGAKS